MEKIKVSREVAAALDTALKVMDKRKFFEEHCNKFRWMLDIYLPLNQISNWEMAQILINGYEVEETPEEKLLETYKNQMEWQKTNDIYDKGVHRSFANSMVYTLDTLGIKIKGIND